MKWTLLLSAAVMPFSYATSIILGRISPEALGIYGILALFGSATTTFLMFGGNQTIVRFLPQVSPERKTGFIFSYAALVFLLASFVVLCFALDPSVLTYVLKRDIYPNLLPYLIFLIPIVLLLNISLAILQAQLEIKWMSVAQKLTPTIAFLGASFVYFFSERLFEKLLAPIVILTIFSYAVPLLLALPQIYKKLIGGSPVKIGFYFPKRFWHFAFIVHLGAISAFVLDSFDQALVLSRFDVGQLGLYRASLVTAHLVRWVPLILTQTMFPTFSNLVAINEGTYIRDVYQAAVKYNTLVTSCIALTFILFPREILSMFGSTYLEGEIALVILGSAFILSSISTVNNCVIIAKGRVIPGVLNGLIGSGVQIFASLLLVDRWGSSGAATGKALSLVSMTLLSAWIAFRIMDLKPDKGTFVILAIDALLIGLSRIITPSSSVLTLSRNLIALAGFMVIVIKAGVLSKKDRRLLKSVLLASKRV